MNERTEKIRTIQELNFTMIELGLYLNNHPDSSEAMARFENAKTLYMNARNEYENLYGPLSYNGINTAKDGWSWIESPWPWEGVY